VVGTALGFILEEGKFVGGFVAPKLCLSLEKIASFIICDPPVFFLVLISNMVVIFSVVSFPSSL